MDQRTRLRKDISTSPYVQALDPALRQLLVGAAEAGSPIDTLDPVGLGLVRIWFERGWPNAPERAAAFPWVLPADLIERQS